MTAGKLLILAGTKEAAQAAESDALRTELVAHALEASKGRLLAFAVVTVFEDGDGETVVGSAFNQGDHYMTLLGGVSYLPHRMERERESEA